MAGACKLFGNFRVPGVFQHPSMRICRVLARLGKLDTLWALCRYLTGETSINFLPELLLIFELLAEEH